MSEDKHSTVALAGDARIENIRTSPLYTSITIELTVPRQRVTPFEVLDDMRNGQALVGTVHLSMSNIKVLEENMRLRAQLSKLEPILRDLEDATGTIKGMMEDEETS